MSTHVGTSSLPERFKWEAYALMKASGLQNQQFLVSKSELLSVTSGHARNVSDAGHFGGEIVLRKRAENERDGDGDEINRIWKDALIHNRVCNCTVVYTKYSEFCSRLTGSQFTCPILILSFAV